MKRTLNLILLIAIVILGACGKSEAVENYEKCNEELEAECTQQEFEEWLMMEAEYNKLIPFSELDNTNQIKYLEEVEEQIEDIFGN
ncbi:hypothetical protein LCM23_12820 [Cytobacillus kochii]|uniref:hypothetical protein n=1 Tax=Cytobacillus kochii TaxID=859143 RepID=UPI001CD8018B|nr:hypothetical protein [Cytobacillus kochii]MCA1026976.1 hypothetical protein [Cytobacillus kochii]